MGQDKSKDKIFPAMPVPVCAGFARVSPRGLALAFRESNVAFKVAGPGDTWPFPSSSPLSEPNAEPASEQASPKNKTKTKAKAKPKSKSKSSLQQPQNQDQDVVIFLGTAPFKRSRKAFSVATAAATSPQDQKEAGADTLTRRPLWLVCDAVPRLWEAGLAPADLPYLPFPHGVLSASTKLGWSGLARRRFQRLLALGGFLGGKGAGLNPKKARRSKRDLSASSFSLFAAGPETTPTAPAASTFRAAKIPHALRQAQAPRKVDAETLFGLAVNGGAYQPAAALFYNSTLIPIRLNLQKEVLVELAAPFVLPEAQEKEVKARQAAFEERLAGHLVLDKSGVRREMIAALSKVLFSRYGERLRQAYQGALSQDVLSAGAMEALGKKFSLVPGDITGFVGLRQHLRLKGLL